MKNIYRYSRVLWLLLLLPLFAGCNDTDDVAAIFTGKTWKLNYITADGQYKMYPFWKDEPGKEKESMAKLNQAGTYTLRFEGAVEGDVINGKVTGRIIANAFEGNWSANAKNNKFQASVTGSSENDILAKNFLEGLRTATSYEGDTNNLYLIYKSGQQTFRMVFRVADTK